MLNSVKQVFDKDWLKSNVWTNWSGRKMFKEATNGQSLIHRSMDRLTEAQRVGHLSKQSHSFVQN